MKTYIINEWYHSDDNGTGCVLRTNDEAEFVRKVREIRARGGIAFQRAHETEYGIFYSFTRKADVKNAMLMWPIFGRKPITMTLRRKLES